MLGVFQSMSDENFLAPLRESIASLETQNPRAAILGVSAALEGIESTFRCGEKGINEFLAAYGTLPRESRLRLDETETLRYLRLTDNDIRFLVHATETMQQVAEFLRECACACRKDVLSIGEFSGIVNRTSKAVLHHTSALADARVVVLPMLLSMWRPGCSVNQDGILVNEAEDG